MISSDREGCIIQDNSCGYIKLLNLSEMSDFRFWEPFVCHLLIFLLLVWVLYVALKETFLWLRTFFGFWSKVFKILNLSKFLYFNVSVCRYTSSRPVEQVDSGCIDTFIVATAPFSAWLWCCKCRKEGRKKLEVVVFLLQELLQCKEWNLIILGWLACYFCFPPHAFSFTTAIDSLSKSPPWVM